MNINEFETAELPKISDKQYAFVAELYRNKKNRVLAYRCAYNSNGKYGTVWKEATKLINNPSVAQYIAYYDKKYSEWAEKEIKYTVQDAVDELDMIMDLSMEGDKNGTPNVQGMLKAVELKCKLKGYGKDNICVSGDVTMMPDIEIDGKKFEFKVGENVGNSEQNINKTADDIG